MMKLQAFLVCVFIIGINCTTRNFLKRVKRASPRNQIEIGQTSGRKQFNQNDAFHADCGEGKILNVLEADYRTPGNGNSECGDEASMAKVKEECNGKNRCQFTVNDDFFDSTCPSNKQEKLWIEYRCENNPCDCFYCAHDGECKIQEKLDGYFEAQCDCAQSWNGVHCDANACEGHECPDNSVCTIDPNSGAPKCCCDEGFTGPMCTEVDACTNNPCEGEGQCIEERPGQAKCVCGEGTAGELCEIDCMLQLCPEGFVNVGSGCYFVSTDTAESWVDAVEKCKKKDAFLWEPNTDFEADVITQYIGNDGAPKFWTSATELLTGDEMPVFIRTGEKFTLTVVNTPENNADRECVGMVRTASNVWQFRTNNCVRSNRNYVCEKQNPCQSPE